ncbi:MAG: TonB-dependent receptor, partial [Gammaproteobacteria bacterium]|nr:TonB-dependent receptor [Gammaproteobacteria bacterium]
GKRNPQINGLFDIDMHYQTLGLNWQQKLNPKLRAQTIFEVRHVRQKQQIGADQNGPLYSKATEYRATWHPQLTWFSSRQNEYRFGSEIAYARFPVDLNNKAAGVAGEYTPRTLRETIALKDTLHAIGATPYIKQRRQWTQQLTTIIGLRYSKIRASDGVDLNDFSPRASVEYQTLLGPLLTASWGRYVQMPGEIQLLPDYGNPYLTFNRAEHRVLGLQQKLNPNWHLQVEAYHKPMNNLVVHNTTLTPRYLNQGEGEAYGFDILLKRRQSNGRMGWLAYSFSHSQRTHLLTQTTSTFSGDIPHNLTLIWGQPLPGTWQRWQWGFKFNIRSGRAYTPVIAADKYCYSEVLAGDPDPKCDDQSIDPANEDVFLVPTYAKPANQTRMPIYYKLDVRIEREIRFNTWRLKLYADIQNLTARENVVAFNYGQYFENINNPKAIKNPGIAFPFLGLEAIF